MDMFESGLDHLFSLPEVKSDTGAVVIGTSKGGEIALSMSAYLPPGKVSGVISINGLCNVLQNDVTYKGRTVIKGDSFFQQYFVVSVESNRLERT